ncbi:retrovirus-related pol polyprotein from transposon TNT 1-94 [Tanacetum coccineum]
MPIIKIDPILITCISNLRMVKIWNKMKERKSRIPVHSGGDNPLQRYSEFLNKTLNAFFKEEGIEHQTSTPRTPKQNGVVERRNRTLVEAARTMLSASKLPLFFWAEAIATACYTQNRSIITCYLTRDGENLDKMKEKEDPCILVGYSAQSKGYHVYNKRTKLIVESIHLRFDVIKEMSEMSVANDTSDLIQQLRHNKSWNLLFGPLYDEFFNAGNSRVNKSSSPTDNSTQQDTLPSTNIDPTSEPTTPTNIHAEENNDNQAADTQHEFTNPFCTPIQEVSESSSRNIVQTRRQLATNTEMCMFALTVSTAEPKNIKEAMADSAWIEAMQEELHQFDRIQVWELVDKPIDKNVIKLKWLWKNKKDEDQTKANLENTVFLGDKLCQLEVQRSDDCTAMSSVKAEYVALSASCAQHSRTKHIHIRYHFIKEQVENGIIELYCVRTEYQLADMFTKALPEDRFQYLVRRIGMRCLTPAELEVLANESV